MIKKIYLFVLLISLCAIIPSAFADFNIMSINQSGVYDQKNAVGNSGGNKWYAGQTFDYNGSQAVSPTGLTMRAQVVVNVPTCFAQIYATSGDLPTGNALITSSTSVCNAVGAIVFNFTNNSQSIISLNSTNKYAIVINTSETVGAGTYTYMQYSNGGAYTGGRQVQKTEGSGWVGGDAGYDFMLNLTAVPYVTTVPAFSTNAKKIWDNSTINTFDIVMQSGATTTSLSTTNGTINTPYFQNDTRLWNITYSVTPFTSNAYSYFNKTYYNVNISSNHVGYLAQVDADFVGRQLFTNTTLTDNSFVISSGGITRVITYGQKVLLNDGLYNVTAYSNTHFNKTVQFNLTLSGASCLGDCISLNTTQYVNNLGNAQLNITANSVSSTPISTFNITINNSVYAYSAGHSTATNSILIDLLNGTYDIVIDAQNYALSNKTVLVNGSKTRNNVSFSLFTTNSINITFKDELNNTVLAGNNISLTISSSVFANNYTTTNGTMYIDFISPASYTFVYSAPLYSTKTYYIEVVNRTTQSLTLYMLRSDLTINVTGLVIDQTGRQVESALVKILRYDVATNSYLLRQSIFTTTEGQFVFPAQLNDQIGLYKFIVESPVNTVVLTTAGQPLYSNTLTLVTDPASSMLQQYNSIRNISSDLFFSGSTNTFRETYTTNNNDISQVCLNVYRIYTNITSVYNSTCSNASTAVLYIGIENITGRSYRADAVFTIDGEQIIIDQMYKNYLDAATFGLVGVFICFIATIGFIFVFRESASNILMVAPIPVTLTNIMGITAFQWDFVIGAWILCIVGIVFLRR